MNKCNITVINANYYAQHNFTHTRKTKYATFTMVVTHPLHIHYCVTLLLWQPLKKNV